jgi:hypothetical protein
MHELDGDVVEKSRWRRLRYVLWTTFGFLLKATAVVAATVAVVTIIMVNPNYIFGWDGVFQGEMVEQLRFFEKTYMVDAVGGTFELELDIYGVDPSAAKAFEAWEEYGHLSSLVASAYACDETLETPFVMEASACATTYNSTLLFKGKARATWVPEGGERVELVFDGVEARYEVTTGGFSRDGDPDGWNGHVHLSAPVGARSLDVLLHIESNWGAPRVTLRTFELMNETFVIERDDDEFEEHGLTPVSEQAMHEPMEIEF